MKLYAWSGAIVPAAQVPVVVVFKVLISTKETVSDLWELVGVDRADLLSCIESWKFKQRAQDELNEGKNSGPSFLSLDNSRLRCFGGAGKLWAGHCAPFKSDEFNKKPFIPLSGWPISFSDLKTYYKILLS